MREKHGGNLARAAREYNLNQEEIIDFSANINFLGPPQAVLDLIQNQAQKIFNYPEAESKGLKECLSKQLGMGSDKLIVGNGAGELIYLLAQVLQPEQALVLAPTFSEYEAAVRSSGGEVEEYYLTREHQFELKVPKLLPQLKKVDLFFLCNPNNPTGKFLSRQEVVEIIEAGKQEDTFIVVDEAFVDLLEEDISVLELVGNYDNLFVLRSLTKFFALPGLRLGYGVGNSSLVSKLIEATQPWNVNLLAQLAGKAALKSYDYKKRTKKLINQEKEFLYRKLSDLPGLKVYYPTANYILVDISRTSFSATELTDLLGKQGILVRNCNTFTGLGEDFIRVAVKSREANQKLIQKLTKVLGNDR
jgi:threonine-phosphate decarboxylase